LGSVKTDKEGSFSEQVKVPEDAEAGEHSIYAIGINTVHATFNVTPITATISIINIRVDDAEGEVQDFVIPGLEHGFDVEIEYDLKIGDEGYVQIQVLSNGEVIKSERINVHKRKDTVSVYVSSCNIPADAVRVDIKAILFLPGMGMEESNVYDVKTVPVNLEHPEISQISFTSKYEYIFVGPIDCRSKLKVPPYTIFLYPSAWFESFEFEISASITQRSKVGDVYAFIKNRDSDEVVMLTRLLDLDEDGTYEGTYEVRTTVESFQNLRGGGIGNNYVLEITVIEKGSDNTISAHLDHNIIIEDVPVAVIEYTKGEVSIDRGLRKKWMDKPRKNWLYRGDIVQLGSSSPPYQGVSEIKIQWLFQGVKGIARLNPIDVFCDKFVIGATREASGWPMPWYSVLFTQMKEQAKSQAIELFVTKILKVSSKVYGVVSMVLTTARTAGRPPIIYINLESEILIKPNPDGTLRIFVFEGSPEVFYDYGNSSITLNSGEMTVIGEDNVPSNPVSFDPETVDRWWVQPPKVQVQNLALYRSTDASDFEETTSFTVEDEFAIACVEVINGSETDELRWVFTGPNKIVYEDSYLLGEPVDHDWCCGVLNLQNYDSEKIVGSWNVTLYVNGEEAFSRALTVEAAPSGLLESIIGLLILGSPVILIILIIILIRRKRRPITCDNKAGGFDKRGIHETFTGRIKINLSQVSS